MGGFFRRLAAVPALAKQRMRNPRGGQERRRIPLAFAAKAPTLIRKCPARNLRRNMFDLHPRLASDTLNVCSLPLSRVLLMNDARYPWIILVPERPDLVEMHDLNDDDYALLSGEIREASKRMATLFGAHKMNVAALGNMVPQLHVHVIARPA
tara:strand:- start:28795 stop:29253 length:459 start_codon:yes stop_codon:yes gene_type:complete